jgi:hypothetical protein
MASGLSPSSIAWFYINGQLQTYTSDYSIAGITLTIATERPAPTASDVLKLYGSCGYVAVSGGSSGTSGSSGSSGTRGTSGTSGSSGTSGVGTSGTSGSSGTSGVGTSGTSGTSGDNGFSGYTYDDFYYSGDTLFSPNLNVSTLITYQGSPLGISGGSKFTFDLAIGINAQTGTSLTNAAIVTDNCTASKVYAYCKTAPTGQALIFDINLNGTTIWSTQSNRVQIAASGTSGSSTTFNTASLTEGDILTIDIDQIGSSDPGKDITVILKAT